MTAAAIPVTIVTGFLGAGKTTLLRSLVQRRQTRRLALLINEFGEIAIDGDLMRAGAVDPAQVQIHDFAYGLIAYGSDDQFEPTMLALAARRAQIDHILIETSGLALPTAVMERLQSAALAPHFLLDATLAVVDTPLLLARHFATGTGAAEAAIAEMFARQLAFADVVVLNKIDALGEEELLAAEQEVRACAPNVRFLELAHQAQLDVRLALGLRLHQPTLPGHAHTYVRMPGADANALSDQQRLNGHAHSGLSAHSHGLSTHKHFHEQDPGWMSFTLRSQAAQDAARLHQALADIGRSEPVLRCKGFVWIGADGQRHWQLVQGVRTRVTITDTQTSARPDRSELVFIGYHPSRNNIARLLSEITGSAWQ